MAILFIDGFDYFTDQTPADLAGRWSATGTASGFQRITATRNGHGAAIRILGVRAATRAIGQTLTTVHVAFAFLWDGSISSDQTMLEFDLVSATQLTCELTTSGTLTFKRAGINVLATGTTTLAVDTWNHIAMKIVFNDTTGSIEVRINGSATPDINATGLDTQQSGGPGVDGIVLTGSNSGWNFDDFVLADDTGSQPFLGDYDVYTILPDGAGASAQFTASPAVANYLNVDETTPDGDSTYNESSTLNDKDRHTFGNVPADTDTVYAVQVGAFAKKDIVGSRNIRVIAYDGTTEGQGASNALSVGQYQWVTGMFEDHPSGAAAWTESEVNAGQFGYEIV